MKFLDPLELEFVNGRFWKVTSPFDYAVGGVDGTIIIHVPVGFLTDFDSIPKIFWNILPSTDWYSKAAVIHDLMYQSGKVNGHPITQKYADDVLNEAMEVLATQSPYSPFRTNLQRLTIYYGVRLFGFFTWHKYRKQEQHA